MKNECLEFEIIITVFRMHFHAFNITRAMFKIVPNVAQAYKPPQKKSAWLIDAATKNPQ